MEPFDQNPNYADVEPGFYDGDDGAGGYDFPEDAPAGQDSNPEAGTPADPVAKLTAQLAEMQTKLATTEQRLTDTQQYAHQQTSAKDFAQALIDASQQQWERQNYQQRQAADTAFPTLTEEEMEALVADPHALVRTIHNYSAAAQRQLMAYLGPQLQMANAAASILEPLAEAGAAMADDRARPLARQAGIKDAEFDALLPEADGIIRAAAKGNWAEYQRLRLKPALVAEAVGMAYRQHSGGVPVTPGPRPQSIGVSSGANGPGDTRQRSGIPPALIETAKRLGLDPRKLAQRWKNERAANTRNDQWRA